MIQLLFYELCGYYPSFYWKAVEVEDLKQLNFYQTDQGGLANYQPLCNARR